MQGEPETIAGLQDPQSKDIFQDLSNEIPDGPKIELDDETESFSSSRATINAANTMAEEVLCKAQIAVINMYAECETARLEQQKPLLDKINLFLGIQLVAFNVVILAIVAFCLIKYDSSVLPNLFDFLKYYIGAVFVELVGMLWYITKVTFNSGYTKIVEGILSPLTGQKTDHTVEQTK